MTLDFTPQVIYTLSCSEPRTHYFHIKIKVDHWQSSAKQSYVDFKMATWTPGSYLLREYARFVEGFRAYTVSEEPLSHRKISKNTWRIFPKKEAKEGFFLEYKVYAYDLTVRTAFLDESHGYVNGAAVFMYPADFSLLNAVLHIEPYEKWSEISTALLPLHEDPYVLMVPDFDTLADSPIELGNQCYVNFEAEGLPHRSAWYGAAELPEEKIKKDFSAIIRAATSVFQHHPAEQYLFITHLSATSGGGLEHKNSCSLKFEREQFYREEGYLRFLSLVAHEYFHVWNGKRLRPAPLGPFDYEQENYTSLLWVVEGFTSYYEKLILLKAGIIDDQAFIEENLKRINHVESQPGIRHQSLSEASLDAWIKAYRPHENAHNSNISYYSKGAIIALLLDWEIITRSHGNCCLDDAMRHLYHDYYLEEDRGYTEEELKHILEKYTESSLSDFFEKYIHGTDPVPYEAYFTKLGIRLMPEEEEKKPFLGFSLKKNRVNQVWRDSQARALGLHVGDRIIAVDGWEISDIEGFLQEQSLEDTFQLHVIRDKLLTTVTYQLSEPPHEALTFEVEEEAGEQAERFRKKWLKRS